MRESDGSNESVIIMKHCIGENFRGYKVLESQLSFYTMPTTLVEHLLSHGECLRKKQMLAPCECFLLYSVVLCTRCGALVCSCHYDNTHQFDRFLLHPCSLEESLEANFRRRPQVN